MPCLSYSDPRLAAVYDTLNPWEAHYDFYVEMAGDSPKTVLDMGCGTGRLACALGVGGHRATGAEPAPAMLEVARGWPGADRVTWVLSDAASLDLDTRFDLIVMTGHVFQVFLDDDDVVGALSNLRRHLAPEGRIAFETRNPDVREWRDWTPDRTREILDVPGVGRVDVHYDIADEDGQLVTFETHFRFASGETHVAPHTLRFMGRDDLERLIEAAGIVPLAWYGDWDRSTMTPESPEIIVVTGPAAA